LKRYQFEIVSLLLLSRVIATAGPQEKPKRSGQESVYDELKKAPDKYSGRTNPLANGADAVAAGGVLFEEHCEECYGKEGMGGKKAPSLRAEEVQNASPGAIFWILSNGVVRKKMLVWSKLPEPERWQLVRYIKSLGIASARASRSSKP
jgi:mono/diheme cytochrome c family protein